MILGRQRLSEEYNVHVRTVERAIKALVDEGTLETQGTRGTFVAKSLADVSKERQEAFTPVSHWGEKLSRQRTIGIVTTDDPPSSETEAILRSVEKSLSNAGGSVAYINRTTRGRGLIPMDTAIADLLNARCEAIVALTYNDRTPQFNEFDAMLGGAAVPIIHVSSVSANRPMWSVYYDNIDAGFQAATHLIEKGCTSLYYLASQHFQWADERLLGVQEAMKLAGIVQENLLTRFEENEDENDLLRVAAARRAALETFADCIPQGIVAVNDHMAKGVLLAAQQVGLTAGSDFLLVGFDDREETRAHGISSMRPPVDEMGASAARLTVRALEGDPTYQRVCLSSHLIARASTSGCF